MNITAVRLHPEYVYNHTPNVPNSSCPGQNEKKKKNKLTRCFGPLMRHVARAYFFTLRADWQRLVFRIGVRLPRTLLLVPVPSG